MGESAVADILGFPRMLGDITNPGEAALNQFNQGLPSRYKFSIPGENIPLTPTTADIRQRIINQTGLDYVPSTRAGRVAQKGGEYGLAALLGGPEAVIPGVLAGSAQQTAKELKAPEWMQTLLGLATPFLAHTGLSLLDTLTAPTKPAGIGAAALRVLDEAALKPNPTINEPYIEGAPQTYGSATGDPGILAFEKGRFQQGEMVPKLMAINKGVTEATTAALQGVAPMPSRLGSAMQMENTAANMHQNIVDAQTASKTNEGTLWRQVDPAGTLTTPIAPLETSLQKLQQNLEVARQGDFPGYVNDVIAKWKALGPNVSLNEVKALHTKVLNDYRQAHNPVTGDANAANVLYPVEQALRQTMDGMASSDPAQQAALDAARQASRDHHQIYDNKAVVRTVNGPPSRAGNILNAPEGVDAYHAATGGSPAAMDAARRYFMAGLARDAIGQDGNLSAAAFNNNLRDNQSLLADRRYFTADQADVVKRAGQQLNAQQQTVRAGMGGISPTAQLLSNQQYAEALVGKQAASVANLLGKLRTAAVTGLGHVVGGPIGAVAGFALSHLPGIPYQAAGRAVLNMVDQALADPAVAAELRRFRDNPTTKTMTPRVANLLRPSAYPGYQPPPPSVLPPRP